MNVTPSSRHNLSAVEGCSCNGSPHLKLIHFHDRVIDSNEIITQADPRTAWSANCLSCIKLWNSDFFFLADLQGDEAVVSAPPHLPARWRATCVTGWLTYNYLPHGIWYCFAKRSPPSTLPLNARSRVMHSTSFSSLSNSWLSPELLWNMQVFLTLFREHSELD